MVKSNYRAIMNRRFQIAFVPALILILFIPSLFYAGIVDGQSENLPPVAIPILDVARHEDPYTVKVSEPVYFTARESYDPNPGDNLSFSWSFGDGESSYEVSPIHIYHQIGEYSVSLTVNDTKLSNTNNIKIFVFSEGNHDPIAEILVSSNKDKDGNNYANVSEAIIFDASNSFDPERFPLAYNWDFGDGSSSSQKIVSHQYDEDRTYTVKLTVTDEGGLVSVDSITIIIGTGIGDDKKGSNESTEGLMGFSFLILLIVIMAIIFLMVFWIYLSKLRARTSKRIEKITITSTEQSGLSDSSNIKPPTPTFASPQVRQQDTAFRRTRVDRLVGQESKMKKALMYEKLQHERKKVDSDMKKELEDLGIEL